MAVLQWDRLWRMHFFAAVAAVCLVALVQASHQGPQKVPEYRPDTCLFGDKHKTEPSPEGNEAQLWLAPRRRAHTVRLAYVCYPGPHAILRP